MKLHRFTAATIQKAMASIQVALGAEALIHSTRGFAGGVEVLASLAGDVEEETSAHTYPEQTLIQQLNNKLQMMDETVKKLSSHLNSQIADKLFASQEDQNKLIQNLQFFEKEFINQKNICALVGPTGIGKTTTIAKLTKRHISRFGTKNIGLITLDSKEASAKNHLLHYSQAFNVELEYATDANELSHALHSMRAKKVVLIDTYGVSQRDKAGISGLMNILESQGEKISSFVTLPCNVQEEVLDEIAAVFNTRFLRGCILTKQDECISMSAVLNVCLNRALAIAYICNGQNVIRDIQKADADEMLRKLEMDLAVI
jgi:flagellar biosynthesis protein FlhF